MKDSYYLKKKLFKLGLKKCKCEKCGLIEWLGQPIPLEIHHIDGNHSNNDLNNLQILCPNCHAQTDNYRNRVKQRKQYYCTICGAVISEKRHQMCAECLYKSRGAHIPSKDVLLEKFKTKNKTQIANEYGVSATAVRYWFKKYNI